MAEEGEHAELAWRTLAWALEQGGEHVRRALEDAFADVRLEPVEVASSSPRMQAHGLLSSDARRQAVQECWEHVIRPVFAQLVGRAAA